MYILWGFYPVWHYIYYIYQYLCMSTTNVTVSGIEYGKTNQCETAIFLHLPFLWFKVHVIHFVTFYPCGILFTSTDLFSGGDDQFFNGLVGKRLNGDISTYLSFGFKDCHLVGNHGSFNLGMCWCLIVDKLKYHPKSEFWYFWDKYILVKIMFEFYQKFQMVALPHPKLIYLLETRFRISYNWWFIKLNTH